MGQIIAALDLGTSKSVAFVSRKDYSGKLSVLRTETLPSKNAIRRGRVYNLDETAGIISNLIKKLKNDPALLQLEKIYVGIGGQSLHTQPLIVKRAVESGTVNYQLLESIKEEAQQYKPEFDENLGVISCEYYADGQLEANPKGTMASTLEARFLLIVGNPCLKRNLVKIFEKIDIAVAGYFISPLATAEAVLTAQEKESGCALIEWGEGVTYISVYKNKALKYMVTLPIGGLAITKDIRSLNVSEEEAETLKIKHGNAISQSTDSGEVPVNEEQSSPRKISQSELNWIIESRVDEIVRNVWTQIEASGYSQALDAGIVITGGGALLRDLPLYIRNQTGKEVRLANAKVWENQQETQSSPAHSCVIGLAIMGKDNCVKEKVVEKPKDMEQSLFRDDEIEKREKEKKEKEKKPERNQGDGQHGDGKGVRNIFSKIFEKGASIFDESDNNTNEQ
jgi:cell division protein FtsA